MFLNIWYEFKQTEKYSEIEYAPFEAFFNSIPTA